MKGSTLIYLRSEPQGESYRALVRFIRDYTTEFSLVLRRKRSKPGSQASLIIARLAPFALESADVTSWPGTQLGSGAGTAGLAKYRLTDETMDVLLAQESLYGWQLPNLPEDPAFYAADGSCFFSATCHEREAMLCSGAITEEQFARRNPLLRFTWYPGTRR